MSFSVVINIAQVAAPWWLWPSLLHVYHRVPRTNVCALDRAAVVCRVLSSFGSRRPLFFSFCPHTISVKKQRKCVREEMLFPVTVRTSENKFGVNVFLMFISIINLLLAAKRSVVCIQIIIHSLSFNSLVVSCICFHFIRPTHLAPAPVVSHLLPSGSFVSRPRPPICLCRFAQMLLTLLFSMAVNVNRCAPHDQLGPPN